MKKIVLALGGNAILDKDPSEKAQRDYLAQAAKRVVELVAAGHQLTIIHGNGPQVGNLLLQQRDGSSEINPALSLESCVAMTQGSLGFWLELAIRAELATRRLNKGIITLVTQVEVAENDPAFQNPTKPIGPFFTEAEVADLQAESGATYMEDAGRGYRQVVPSPKPEQITNGAEIKLLADAGTLVIAGGGGGIPVVHTADGFKSIAAVIDKDLTAIKLAEAIDADTVIFLTGVPNVYLNYGKVDEKMLEQITTAELTEYIAEDHFPAGSMLPKVEAALTFAESGQGKESIITDEDHLLAAIQGDGGTIVAKV